MDVHTWITVLLVVINGFFAIAGYVFKDKMSQLKDLSDSLKAEDRNLESDIKRIERLVNITREELARDYTTNAEVQRLTDHMDQRFNKLEDKIDQLIKARG
jgi:ABC-type transporter Mla subunit MlaD